MRAAVTVRRPAVLLAVALAAGAAVLAGPAAGARSTVGRLARVPGRYVSEMSVGELPEVRYPEACS
jgi:hypothetical protein